MEDKNQQATPWHTLSSADACKALDCESGQGLDPREAEARLGRHGENRLLEQAPRHPIRRFLDQFRSFLVMVLLVAAVLAWAIGDLKDAVVILVVVVFNACLGFYQEHRAENTLAALKGMLAPAARVRRGGKVMEIEAAGIVPGDIVLLEAGDRVPADGRLLAAHNLEVDEAALTGESQAVGKRADRLEEENLPLAERANMLFMNTVVTRGRAELLITATGMASEMGRLAGIIARTSEPETPLQRQLDVLGKRLAAIAGAVVLLIFMLALLRGVPWAEAAMTSVALAVAAIPEGLPAVVTVTLALGMWRMARNRAILKKLAAVETLGSTTVICSDKTGTLTLNQMTVRAGWFGGERFQVSGEGYQNAGEIEGTDADLRPLLRPMALCTESSVENGKLLGDPTEGALYVLAQKGGLDPGREQQALPRIAEIPFDSAYKFMATFHREGDRVLMFIKGAPDVLLEKSEQWQQGGGARPMDDSAREEILRVNKELGERALRVLAVASRDIDAADFDPAADLWRWAEGWTFQGLAGLMDPPRPEARSAIALCRKAGVQVKMITGDHKVTAGAVGRELGLGETAVSGAELDGMSDEDLVAKVEEISVFARVAPEHKVRIVRALKAHGEIVAMTGDGVNDAPALKNADIGVAMGITGTAVTREAATLVLTDDNFSTIVRAVEEGRVIYDNIVKFVRFQLSTNIGAILTVLAATLLALPTPFTPIQLLWVNIVMDGPPAMTLGVEPGRPGLMEEPPRAPGPQILSMSRLLRLLFYGAVMMAGSLWVYTGALASGDQAYAMTLTFTTFVLFQFFNIFNARSEQGSAFATNFFRNGKLWLALLGVLLLQIVIIHWPPAREIFDTQALSVSDWLLALAVASSVLLLEEGRKLLWRGRHSTGSR